MSKDGAEAIQFGSTHSLISYTAVAAKSMNRSVQTFNMDTSKYTPAVDCLKKCRLLSKKPVRTPRPITRCKLIEHNYMCRYHPSVPLDCVTDQSLTKCQLALTSNKLATGTLDMLMLN
jgi:hypothetical protein